MFVNVVRTLMDWDWAQHVSLRDFAQILPAEYMVNTSNSRKDRAMFGLVYLSCCNPDSVQS